MSDSQRQMKTDPVSILLSKEESEESTCIRIFSYHSNYVEDGIFLSLYNPEHFCESLLTDNRYFSTQEIKTLQKLLGGQIFYHVEINHQQTG